MSTNTFLRTQDRIQTHSWGIDGENFDDFTRRSCPSAGNLDHQSVPGRVTFYRGSTWWRRKTPSPSLKEMELPFDWSHFGGSKKSFGARTAACWRNIDPSFEGFRRPIGDRILSSRHQTLAKLVSKRLTLRDFINLRRRPQLVTILTTTGRKSG